MKTGSEHSGANIPKSWLRGFNHDSEKKNPHLHKMFCFRKPFKYKNIQEHFKKNFTLTLIAMAKKKQLVTTMLALKEMAILYQMFILYLTQIRNHIFYIEEFQMII